MQKSHYLLIGFVHIPPMCRLGHLLPSILLASSIWVNSSFQQMDCKLEAAYALMNKALYFLLLKCDYIFYGENERYC